MALQESEVIKQSKTAFKQWDGLWRKNSTYAAEIYKKSTNRLTDFLFKGKGKVALTVAFGHSFENQIDVLKEYADKERKFDTFCVDKCIAFMPYAPEFCVIADATISADWLEGVDTSKTTLITNVCANPEWAQKWQGPIYYYVNKDNIKTQDIYGPISGCNEQIPASSNVGNCQIMLSTTVFGYDRTIMLGYDFCFEDSYYAFHEQHPKEHSDKLYYMAHRLAIDKAGRMVSTSENLLFSAKWLNDYLTVCETEIFSADKGTLSNARYVDLRRQLEIADVREITAAERKEIISKVVQKVHLDNREDAAAAANDPSVLNIFLDILPEAHKQWALN